MLQEIVKELETSPEQERSIPRPQVRRWMNSEDIEELGATYGFLSNAAQIRRVSPVLEFDEVFDFMLRYYELCLVTDPKSKWANSRYSAGWDLTGWFIQMWDEKRNTKYFQSIKSLLEKLYVTGDPELRKCIEHSVMEHLFERKPIRKFFEDWAHNPQLRSAFDEAKTWTDSGGMSPLTDGGGPDSGDRN
jgi:hypothetical protein